MSIGGYNIKAVLQLILQTFKICWWFN